MRIQQENPVWFFDATGSILKDIKEQKSPLLYSLVMHDPTTSSIIPVYDFITTSNTITTISKYLFFFQKKNANYYS